MESSSTEHMAESEAEAVREEEWQEDLPPGAPHGFFAPDPAQSFMWGAHNLFAGLFTVNSRLERLEAMSSTTSPESWHEELEKTRAFAESVHQRIESLASASLSKDTVEHMIDERTEQFLTERCLPEVFKLRAHIDHMQQVPPPVGKAYSSDLETILLRLAAFGDERIQHVEIVGDGRRYRSGAPRRMILFEKDLTDGKVNLPLPKSWKSDSDSRTINKNFEQVTKMINEIVLKRVDELEDRIDRRLDLLEKRVDILNNLFHAINNRDHLTDHRPSSLSHSEGQVDTGETIQQRFEQDHAPAASTSAITCSEREVGGGTEVMNSNSSATRTLTISNETKVQPNTTLQTTSQDFQTAPGKEGNQTLSQQPKKNLQSGAKAGRAAFNRAQQHQDK